MFPCVTSTDEIFRWFMHEVAKNPSNKALQEQRDPHHQRHAPWAYGLCRGRRPRHHQGHQWDTPQYDHPLVRSDVHKCQIYVYIYTHKLYIRDTGFDYRHGVRQMLSCWADGPSYITQCPIQPGQTYTYEFTIVHQRGTLWWHAHISWMRATVHGALVIYPKKGVPYPFKHPYEEHILIFGNYSTSQEQCRVHVFKLYKLSAHCITLAWNYINRGVLEQKCVEDREISDCKWRRCSHGQCLPHQWPPWASLQLLCNW